MASKEIAFVPLRIMKLDQGFEYPNRSLPNLFCEAGPKISYPRISMNAGDTTTLNAIDPSMQRQSYVWYCEAKPIKAAKSCTIAFLTVDCQVPGFNGPRSRLERLELDVAEILIQASALIPREPKAYILLEARPDTIW